MSKIILIWIDLWTTNSAIAINNKGSFEVIKNPEQMDFTPSVFWFNKGKNKQVGQNAYDALFKFSDQENVKNYKAEVKRLMGTKDTIPFSRNSEDYTAEEISSEILKYLKESILKKYSDFETSFAVITVPAYFDTVQKEATKRAGELAWFKYVILLQEPIAAAIAYGFENKKNENRLVYDFWGGTFDVAIISSKDWVLTVKWHSGDNFLWWKDIDNLIIDKVIVPAINNKFSLKAFLRSSVKYQETFNRIKYFAESAKKNLSNDEVYNIEIDNVWKDDNWEEIYLSIEITRKQFEKLIADTIQKTIDLSEEAIKESGLTKSDLSRIILVWWPTQIPYIRETLEKELKIKVDSSVDPLTVVAKWASIYWATQIIPEEYIQIEKKKKDSVSVKLNYEPMTSDSDTLITGVIAELSNETEDYFIQIQSEDGQYSSSKIKLKNGKFFDTVLVQEGKTNNYFLYLTDNNGNLVDVSPDNFSITHGLSLAGAPLSYSVSVALNKKTLLWAVQDEVAEIIFERWSILPLKKTVSYKTARALKKWDAVNVLPIKIYEWESKRPNRNKLICDVIVEGKEIPYDLPEWTEISLTMEVDQSGEIKLSIYVPSIDFSKSWKQLRTEKNEEKANIEEMTEDLVLEKDRFAKLEPYLPQNIKDQINNTFKNLNDQLKNKHDEDSKRKSLHEIKKLKIKLDEHEDVSSFESMKNSFDELYEEVQKSMSTIEEPMKKNLTNQLSHIKNDFDKALEEESSDMLEHALEKLREISLTQSINSKDSLMLYLAYQYKNIDQCSDQERANQLFSRALQLSEMNDISWLRSTIREIMDLMPEEDEDSFSNLSGISK